MLKFTCKKYQRYNVLIDPKWQDEIQAKRDKMFQRRASRPEWQSYKRVNSEFRLSKEGLDELKTLEIDKGGKTKTYEREHDAIVNGTYPIKQRSGGYYSEHNNIPDVMRVQRQNKLGERLAISDQSSAHGFFFHVMMAEIISHAEERGTRDVSKAKYDLGQFGKDLTKRRLYDLIPKPDFVAMLNARYGQYTQPSVKEAFHKFEKLYPAIYPIFLSLKKRHDHKLFLPITHRQTIMMEEGSAKCLEWGFDAQILGDELEVPESQIMRVKDLMLDLIFKHTGLEAWVKITIHGKEDERFRYQTKTPCPPDLCRQCWNKNKMIRIESPFPCKHIKGKLTGFPIHPKGNTESDAG